MYNVPNHETRSALSNQIRKDYVQLLHSLAPYLIRGRYNLLPSYVLIFSVHRCGLLVKVFYIWLNIAFI